MYVPSHSISLSLCVSVCKNSPSLPSVSLSLCVCVCVCLCVCVRGTLTLEALAIERHGEVELYVEWLTLEIGRIVVDFGTHCAAEIFHVSIFQLLGNILVAVITKRDNHVVCKRKKTQ